MIVVNLWNKNLAVGDVILTINLVDSRWGPLRQYSVERTEEAHAIQVAKEQAEKAAQDEAHEREKAEILARRAKADADWRERDRIAQEKAMTRREKAAQKKAAKLAEAEAAG